MGLIKSTRAPTSLVPFSMKDIESQARAVVLRAQRQADQLLASAQVEAQNLRAREKALGFAEGRAEGVVKGQEEGRAEGTAQALEEHRSALTQLVTALNATTQQVEDSRRRLEDDARAEVIKLAVAIAQRVTKRQGALDPNVVTENVLAAIKMVVHSTDLRIAVHPSQRQTLLEALPQLKLEWPALEHVELVDDASLSPGGCRIFTRNGLVDADLDEQLNRIAADLLPQREGEALRGGEAPGSAGASPSHKPSPTPAQQGGSQ